MRIPNGRTDSGDWSPGVGHPIMYTRLSRVRRIVNSLGNHDDRGVLELHTIESAVAAQGGISARAPAVAIHVGGNGVIGEFSAVPATAWKRSWTSYARFDD